jgi:putative transposase
VFKTARFKVHNPSRHKLAMLRYALEQYHLTLKRVLEAALADPDLLSKITKPDKKGKPRVNGFAISRLLYRIAPKNWALAPLRDYLIGDATAMLLSHFKKAEKGKNKSNPPTMPSLDPVSELEFEEAYRSFTEVSDLPLKPQHLERIEKARDEGHTRVADRLERIYRNWSVSRAAGALLRSLEGAMPRPIEFTRPEFERGYLLARHGSHYYLLIRLFAATHHYREQKVLADGFLDWRTREPIAGRKYPGLILPLELGREYHDQEFLEHGRPQSAKLVPKRNQNGDWEFYAHIAFEFTPETVPTETILGIDRGAAKLGSATVIDGSGRVLVSKLELEGTAFAAEMKRLRSKIANLQKRGRRTGKVFKLRGRKADEVIGEYANRVIQTAREHRSQIAIEQIKGTTMARFLTQSQFAKLKSALTYKSERVGLPAPIEVPPAYTSQTCAKCGHTAKENRPRQDAEGRNIQGVFRCVACGYQANADDNASEVIALRALHQQLQGGKYQKFDTFSGWLKGLLGRDSLHATSGAGQ